MYVCSSYFVSVNSRLAAVAAVAVAVVVVVAALSLTLSVFHIDKKAGRLVAHDHFFFTSSFKCIYHNTHIQYTFLFMYSWLDLRLLLLLLLLRRRLLLLGFNFDFGSVNR